MGETHPIRGCLAFASVILIDLFFYIWNIIRKAQHVGHNYPLNNKEEYMHGVFTFIAIYVVFRLLLIVFTIVLIVGIHQRKRGYVKAYLIYATLYLVLYITVYSVALATKNPNTYINVAEIVRNVIVFLFDILFLIAIWAYYIEMGDPANMPAAVFNTA